MPTNEKSERLVEVASVALESAPEHRLNAVVLNKVLFYADLVWLRDHGETLTKNAYIALQQGPVVAKYPQRLIGELERLGVARQEDEWDGSKPVTLIKSAGITRFVGEEARGVIRRVTGFLASRTSRQVSDFSHENPGWAIAWAEYHRTGRPSPVDMAVAMQQLLEDDPWMDEPLSGADDLLASADAGDGIEW